MRAESAFGTLVNALNNPSVVGRDSCVAPLSQNGLAVLIKDAASMTKFVQRKFKFRGSEAKLSDRDAENLALEAVRNLCSGAFFSCTLARAFASMSVSPPHQRVGVPWSTFTFPCYGHPSRPRPSRYGGAHVAATRGWCHCTRSPTGVVVHITRPPAQMFCDAPCRMQSRLVCHFGCPRPSCW